MSAAHPVQEAVAKLAVGPGAILFGYVTLNDVALIAGICCSLVIAAKTGWELWASIQDRRARPRQ